MAFGRKRDEIDALTRANQILQSEAERAQQDAVVARSELENAEDVVAAALGEIRVLEEGGILRDEASGMAKVAIYAAEKSRLTDELAETLKRQEYDRHAAKIRIEEGSRIRKELHTLFQTDGTFDTIRAKAEEDVRTEIHAEVLGSSKQKARDETDTEENRRRFFEEITPEVEESEQIEEFRRQTREELESQWREEAEEDAKDLIKAEEESKEQSFKENYEALYVESRDGVGLRKRIETDLQKKQKV